VPNSDYSPVEPLPSLVQKCIKANLAGAFASKEIVTALEIDWHGRVQIELKKLRAGKEWPSLK